MGQGQGDAQLLPQPCASLGKAPLHPSTTLPALVAINPLPTSVKTKRKPAFNKEKKEQQQLKAPELGCSHCLGLATLWEAGTIRGKPLSLLLRVFWHCFSPGPFNLF